LGAHEVGEKLKDIFKKWEDGKYSTENSKGD